MIKGKDLFLYIKVAGVPTAVAYAQNCEQTITADAIECTTFGSNSFKDYVYGDRGYTLTHTGLTTIQKNYSSLALQQAIINGTKIDFVFGGLDPANGVFYSGTCMITQTDLDSSYDGISTFKATLLGCGALAINQSTTTTTIYAKGFNGSVIPSCAVGGTPSTLFPCGVYNVNGVYLGAATTAANVVTLWNADTVNQTYGVLSAGPNGCSYVLTSPFSVDRLPDFILLEAGFSLYYGPSAAIPVTGSDILALNQTIFAPSLTLNTGTTNSVFSIVIQTSKTISAVTDLDAGGFSDIKSLYTVQGTVTISEVVYNIYTMVNALPYSTNHRHQFTLN